MGKVYKNQTALTIKLDTKVTLENVQTALIKYKKPDGTLGSFPGVVNGTLVTYKVLGAIDLDQFTGWAFWAHITFTNGDVVAGEPAFVTVYEEGEK